jgi:hypothetical protein
MDSGRLDSSSESPAPDGGIDDSSVDGAEAASSTCALGSEASDVIYVVSDSSSTRPNTLYTFNPKLFPSPNAFNAVGNVPCVPNNGYVNSLAIDRQGNAYLNMYPDGTIWKVATTAPVTCAATKFQAAQAGFSNDLAMAFAVDPSTPTGETLYVSDSHGPLGNCTATTPTMGSCWGLGLGKVDTSSWTLTRVGMGYTSTAAGYNAELTGTGMSGTHSLYGFFTTTPSSYGPIDPGLGTTDNPVPTPLSAVNIATGAYAFSSYGGDFYFFTSATGNTIPQRLSTATGTVTSGAMLNYVIIAAGSSTCTP